MWKISRAPAGATLSAAAMVLVAGGPLLPQQAAAQGYGYGYPGNSYSNQTYSYGLNLPQVTLPSGSDEVRAADGTTCKSNAASNDAYLDAGAIGSQDPAGSFNQGSVYARIIVPLGSKPRRIDCTALYQLEIDRLKGELDLVRMGANGRQSNLEPAKKGGWQNEGWSDKAWKAAAGPSKVGGPPPSEEPAPARTSRLRSNAGPVGPWETTITQVVELNAGTARR